MDLSSIVRNNTGQQDAAAPSTSAPPILVEETKAAPEPHTPAMTEPKTETADIMEQDVTTHGTSEASSADTPSPSKVPSSKDKPKSRKPKPPIETEPWKRFTFECPISLNEKIHNISWKENVTINSLMAKMLRDGIRSYERKHGVAEATKRSADDLY